MDVYLGLGSNIGDRQRYIDDAVKLLKKKFTVSKLSPRYESAAVGRTDQADFINCVVHVETELSAHDVLRECLKIEHQLGRERREHWGARTIDIDILLYDDWGFNDPHLKIPHPHMHLRDFVLAPLCDIAPTLQHPKFQKSMRALRRELHKTEKQSLKKLK